MISRKGWARLPHSVAAGKPRFAEVEQDGSRIVLTPVSLGEAAPPASVDEAGPSAPAPAGEVAAEVTGVGRRYGERVVLSGFTRSFHRGVLTALVGRSGSGKTTLLHMLAGLDRPDEGEIAVGGEKLGALDRTERAELRRREVSLVTQEPGLIPYLTRARECRARPAPPLGRRRTLPQGARGPARGRSRRAARPARLEPFRR